jgi:hypothetical protein
MCAPTMRFIVMLLPLLMMLHLLRPNTDTMCVGLCASAGVVTGARACPQHECRLRVVYVLRLVCHLMEHADPALCYAPVPA